MNLGDFIEGIITIAIIAFVSVIITALMMIPLSWLLNFLASHGLI